MAHGADTNLAPAASQVGLNPDPTDKVICSSASGFVLFDPLAERFALGSYNTALRAIIMLRSICRRQNSDERIFERALVNVLSNMNAEERGEDANKH